MFITKTHSTVTLTFLFALLAVTLSTPSNALGHSNLRVSARSHPNTLKRFVKKRSPFPQGNNGVGDLIPVIGAGEDPEDAEASSQSSTTTTSETSTSSSTSTTTQSATTTTSSVTTSSSTTTSSRTSSTTSSSTSSTTSSSSASSSSSSSSTTESSSSTSVTPTTSEQPQTSEAINVTNSPENVNADPLTRTLTSSVSPSTSPTTSAEASGASASSTKSTTLTVIIAVAASIGGIIILWTIFRKWKLSRSKDFDKRMQPIDWQPTSDDGHSIGHRSRPSDTSSFHSGVNHNDFRAYGATSDAGHGSSDHGHSSGDLGPLPDHDFTAGSSTVGGYADLNRGPSPQPQMQESLNRGPSLTRPNYDVGVPLHHQAGYGTQGRY